MVLQVCYSHVKYKTPRKKNPTHCRRVTFRHGKYNNGSINALLNDIAVVGTDKAFQLAREWETYVLQAGLETYSLNTGPLHKH